jgi:hypothetical protein
MDAPRPPALRRSWAARCVPSRRNAVRLLAGSLATAASGGAVTGSAFATHPGLNGELAYESPTGGGTGIFTLQPFAGRLNSDTRLTSRRSTAEDPAWSHDGERIAFVSNRDGNREIYVMDNDGGRKTRLTFDPADDVEPSWSHDDETIAFTSTRAGSRDIFVMNKDGSTQTRLTTDPAADSAPDWSPIRRQIAFESNRNGNYEIYSMEDDGSRQTRLTFHTADDVQPSWKPDAKSIAFTSRRMRGSDIFSLAMRNGQRQHRRGRRRLTRDHRDNDSPAFSPDGTSIAFASARFSYVRTFDRRQTRTRLAAVGINPAWGRLPPPSGAPEPLQTVSIFPRGNRTWHVELPGFDANRLVRGPREIPIESTIGTRRNKAGVLLQVAVREDTAARRVRVSRGRATILQEPRDAGSPMGGGAAALQTTEPPDTVLELPKLDCKLGGEPRRNELQVDTNPPAATGPARAFRRLTNLEAGALFAGPRTRVRGRYHTAGSRGTKWRVINTCESTKTVVLSGAVDIEEPGGVTPNVKDEFKSP